jgi:hypothetical protein
MDARADAGRAFGYLDRGGRRSPRQRNFLGNLEGGSRVDPVGCVMSGQTGNPEWRGAALTKIKERPTGCS